MERRQLMMLLAVGALVALAGCGQMQGDTGEQLEEDSGVNVSADWPGESYAFEVRATEDNQLGLVKAQPPFQMERSLERENLIRRYQYLNDQNNLHHVYLISNDGKVIHYSVAQGKVSSVNSKLTNDKQVVRIPDCDAHNTGNDCWKVVESPQMDGSYGTNGNAIFWFTPDGHYMEWNGLYVVSEEPKNIQTGVTLVDEVDDNEDVQGSPTNETDTGNETSTDN